MGTLQQDELLKTTLDCGLFPALIAPEDLQLTSSLWIPCTSSKRSAIQRVYMLLFSSSRFSVWGNIWPRWFGFGGVWHSATERAVS